VEVLPGILGSLWKVSHSWVYAFRVALSQHLQIWGLTAWQGLHGRSRLRRCPEHLHFFEVSGVQGQALLSWESLLHTS
jgi:hypothetical protein